MAKARAVDFRGEIDNAISEWCTREMRWGLSDCATAISDIYKIALGVDPAEPFRGRYRTRIGATRILAGKGVPRVVEEQCRRLGWQRIAVKDARLGDLGIIRMRVGEDPRVAYVCAIRHVEHWVGPRNFGFAAVVDKHVARAWRIQEIADG